ncbi:hypothetical protein C1H46_042316 [Malus baccata]|uniref:Uncharacterized protein n=1 Tax=Malus baccata TaxID=106549 RepID=A0A540KDV8_MALBA|nr:hypothetical protein C1H46_042316 [Malus baccata]
MPASQSEVLPQVSIKGSGEGSNKSPLHLVRKRDLPHPPLVSGITGIFVPEHVKKEAKTTATTTFIPAPALAIFSTLLIGAAPTATTEGVKDAPSASSASSLLEWVNKFR